MIELCACASCAAKLLCSCCLAPFDADYKKNVSLWLDLDMNLRSLVDAERVLEDKADNVNYQVQREMGEDHNREPIREIKQWLDRVEDVFNQSPQTEEYNGLRKCACCYCCSYVVLSSDLQLHRKAKEKLEKVNQLKEQGYRLTPPYTEILEGVRTNRPYSPSIFGMQRLLEPLWFEFQNENTNVIGVFGPGGVGKTTLLKEFKKQVESKQEYTVIFIEVANSAGTLNVADMQKAITSQLNYAWDQNLEENERAKLLFNLLSDKKFVVLLDAVWRSFQLEEVGIPYPVNGSKLIVASWSESVCTDMQAMRPIKMEGLKKRESTKLFMSNLREDLRDQINRDNRLKSSVEKIVRRCGGLPLALNVVGSALACSNYPQVLNNAASEMYDHSKLRDFDRILHTLARSYRKLDETTKMCFLYCVLFPDHGSIDIQLLQDYWLAERLISEDSAAPDAVYSVISNLISACLLQKSDSEPESEVKMHYMIREMGIRQIQKQRYIIEAGRGSMHAPAAEKWTTATRISLMSNRFDELSISPNCPALQTLLLQNNPSLKKLGSNLFRNMPRLKVLDLSHTDIDRLPDCGALRRLAYLNLSHTNIKELPRDICDNLGELLYLNMSHTRFTELPRNLFKLKALTHLILSETSALMKIPNGTISKLFALRVLNLYKSHYGILQLPDLNLEKLEKLHTLGITIHSEPVLDKLCGNQLLANSTGFLSLSDCQGMQSIQISKFENMRQLQELNIESCNGLESIDANISENKDGDDSLKVLNLKNLSDLHQVSVPAVEHHFRSLRHLAIHSCHKLVNVSWVLQLHSLERLEISECSDLEEIAQEQSNGTTSMTRTSGEPEEVINAAAATVQQQSNKAVTTAGGTIIGGTQEENNGPTFTDSNGQEQDASSSQNGELNETMQEQSKASIICEIQEEIDDTLSTQANLVAYASTSTVREERTGTNFTSRDAWENQQDKDIGYAGANLQATHSFKRLKIIVLNELSKLKSISTTSDFPRLASINVRACPNLRKLPVGRMPKLKQIHGEKDWWDGLPPEMNDHLNIFTFIS